MRIARRCSSVRGLRGLRRCWRSEAGPGRSGWTRRFRLPKSTTGFTRRLEFIRTRRSWRTEEHFARLDELAKHPRVIAWGEMGLDYYYDHSPREVQQQVFRRQLEQARAAKLPIVIHCRDAWDGLPGNHGAGLEVDRARRNFALLHGDACGSAARAGNGIYDFVRGECDLSEDAASAGSGAASCRSSEC